jgi:RNA polymerase sigma factor (sigma-70 family)
MNDPLLDRLAAARDAHTADAIIEELVQRAQPVIDGVAAYYRRRALLKPDEIDDVVSTVRMRLLMKLRRIAGGERQAIGSFAGYVAALAYNGVNDVFRLRDPERARLKRQLRAAAQRDPRMVVETTAHGVVCRLRGQSGEPVALREPVIDADEVRERSADAIVAMLRDAGAPLLLDDVIAAMLEVCATRRETASRNEEAADAAPPAPLRLERRQDLELLWREIEQLPAPQRAALLLNLRADDGGNAVALLVLVGVASLDDIAAAMSMPLAGLAAIWNDLPLDDLTIASRLGLTRQQVINLRKSARERLGRKMRGRR